MYNVILDLFSLLYKSFSKISQNDVLKETNLRISLFLSFTQEYSQQELSTFDFKRKMKKSLLNCSDIFPFFNSFVMWSAD